MGKPFSFIHCADLHLGEPFSGLRDTGSGPWAEAIREATSKAFENVVTAAITYKVNAILISGDVYNSENHSLAAQIAFARELYRAALSNIEVFVVHGNHDPALSGWRADIPMVSSVHIFSSKKPEAFPIHIKNEPVAMVYGMSYPTTHVTENLSRRFQKQDDGLFSIGMLHTEIGVKNSWYAPCTVEDLRSTCFDYWALGHIHTKQIVSTEPYIVYSGNTQGMDRSETGARGCYLVEVSEYGVINLKFIETDVIRWINLSVNIGDFQNPEELLRYIDKERSKLRANNGRPLIVRLLFVGRGNLQEAFISAEGKEYILRTLNEKEKFHHNFCYFSDIQDHTVPFIDLEKRRNLPDEMGIYLSAYDEIDKLTEQEKLQTLKKMIKNEPELCKFGDLKNHISDEMLLRAFKKAEVQGADSLWEDD